MPADTWSRAKGSTLQKPLSKALLGTTALSSRGGPAPRASGSFSHPVPPLPSQGAFPFTFRLRKSPPSKHSFLFLSPFLFANKVTHAQRNEFRHYKRAYSEKAVSPSPWSRFSPSNWPPRNLTCSECPTCLFRDNLPINVYICFYTHTHIRAPSFFFFFLIERKQAPSLRSQPYFISKM